MNKKLPSILELFTYPQMRRMIDIRTEIIAEHTSKYPLTHFDFPTLRQQMLKRMVHEILLSTEEEITFVKKGFVNVVLGIHCEQLRDKGFRRIDLELQIIKENGVTTSRDLSLMVPRYQNL